MELYKDHTQSVAARVEDLLSRMTLEESRELLHSDKKQQDHSHYPKCEIFAGAD